MPSNEHIPKIRFRGFGDNWELHKLGEIADFRRGLTYSPLNISSNGIRVLRSSNIAEDTFVISENDVFVKPSAVNIPYTEIGDILITSANGSSRLVGKHAIVFFAHGMMVHGGFMLLAHPHGKSSFVNALMSAPWYANFISTYIAGGNGAIGNLNKSDLEEQEVSVPCDEEQEKIGTFFRELDDLITLHQRKYEKLVNFKKAMLQKMFPKAGADTPEVRFTGFSDKWEKRKLGAITEFNPKTEIPDTFEYVDLESVMGTEMVASRKEYKSTAPSRAQRLAKQGDLFYQMVRPYQKNNYLFEKSFGDYVFSTGYAQMRPKCDGYFLLSIVQSNLFVQTVLRSCTGTSYPAINANDLAEIAVTIPINIEEQEKIGAFFRNLDASINLHKLELDKLKNIKLAYLERMFVS